MTNRTIKEASYIQDLVRKRVRQSGIETTEVMQEYLKSCGYRVSRTTIAEYYRMLGYEPKRQPSFVWKHRKSHE